jgi:hypothetical protein
MTVMNIKQVEVSFSCNLTLFAIWSVTAMLPTSNLTTVLSATIDLSTVP